MGWVPGWVGQATQLVPQLWTLSTTQEPLQALNPGWQSMPHVALWQVASPFATDGQGEQLAPQVAVLEFEAHCPAHR